MNTNKIDVSVCVLTYNHKDLIEQSIESALSQKTKYNYEIVISDDCSTDGTQKILKRLKNKFPEKININLNKENIGIPKNIYKARCMCKGKYIVDLGGDDYWINNHKIETQVNFLENHKEYFGVATRVELRHDDEKTGYLVLPQANNCEKDITVKEYEVGIVPNCHGLMFRNLFLTEEGKEYFKQAQEISDKVDDAVDEVLMLRKGKFYTLDIVTDVYRTSKQVKNKSNYNSKYSVFQMIENQIDLLNKLDERFGNEINFINKYIKEYKSLIEEKAKNKNSKKEYTRIVAKIPKRFRKNLNTITSIIKFRINLKINKLAVLLKAQ